MRQRKAKLVEDAANLIGSDAFGAVVWIFSITSSAQISKHALSHPLVHLFWAFAVVLPFTSSRIQIR